MSLHNFHLFRGADSATVARLLADEYRRSARFAILKGIAISVFIFIIVVMVTS